MDALIKRRDNLKKINFSFDVKGLKSHFYTASYFTVSQNLLLEAKKGSQKATMQFICFSEKDVMVAGIFEVVSLIKQVLDPQTLKQIEVYGIEDGDLVNKNQPILKIIGPYYLYGFLENVIDGILARRSSVANNCYQVLKEIQTNQNVIFMADRTDDYLNQAGDGYAAYIAGIKQFVTEAQISLIKPFDNEVVSIGTMPHALIQQYQNDLETLVRDFYHIQKVKPTVLIDFENDVIKTLEQLKNVFEYIYAVRIDTSKNLIDQSLDKKDENKGVSVNLIKLVRNWLDQHHLEHIKIVVTSGVNLEMIKNFNKHQAPIDIYGIGSYFLSNSVHISADLVKYNQINLSKTGRKDLEPSPNWKKYL